jgi:large subunit ribosomal protein L29
MKTAEYLAELRSMDLPELDARLKEVRTELFNLRFQAATGQLENHRQIRNVRRQIAQVLTVLQGRRLGFDEVVSMDTFATKSQAAPVAAEADAAEATPEEATPEEAAQPEAAAEPVAGDAESAPEAAEPAGGDGDAESAEAKQ